MKKINNIIFTSLILLTCLTGCGQRQRKGYMDDDSYTESSSSKDTDISSSGNDTDISSSGNDTDLYDSKTIVFWHTFGKSNLVNSIETMKESFLKLPENQGYKIELLQQGGYTDINDKLLKAIAAKTLPTMAICYPDHVADYLKAGVVEELSSYVTASETASSEDAVYQFSSSDYITAFWNEGKEYDTKGSLYSVPFSKSTEVMFYNKTFFEKHKIEVPTTWEEVIQVCDAILKLDEIKNTTDYVAPLGYDSVDNMFITFCKQLGIPYTSLTEDGSGSFDFNNSEAKEMVQMIKDWYQAGYITTKGSNTYTSTKFTEGKLHMTIGSTGGTSYNYPSDGSFEVGVAPLPQWNEDEPYCIQQGPSVVFFNKNSEYASQIQLEVAWRFYTYITNPTNSATFSILSGGYEPVRKSSYQTSAYEAYLNGPTSGKTGLYTKVANLTTTIQDWYFTSPVFVGSATARNQVGAIISAVCASEGAITIEKAFSDAYAKCILSTM